MKRRFLIYRAASLFLSLTLVLASPIHASAEVTKEDRLARNQSLAVQSDQFPNWPTAPTVSAASAILMEAKTGTILYEKNIHDRHYPASTTKILTTLIAAEQCQLNETVTFSHEAVFGIPRGSNHIAMNEGDTLSMEQCLNAILIRSANEVSYAVAEHIGGTFEGFARMMNERAKELGALDSNFVNPNGLPDENHYTTAYDLAMIGRAFFDNEMLCQISTTNQLVIPKEKEDLIEWNHMELLPGHKYAYPYLVGCKTGYTVDARSTLVSCAEKNGLKLICVVLQDENPEYYQDTIALFDYGFNNFQKINIAATETKYNIDNDGLFYSGNDIFGSSKPILALNSQDFVVIPNTITFEDLTSSISYDTQDSSRAAVINYSYMDIPVGSASVDVTIDDIKSHSFEDDTLSGEQTPVESQTQAREDESLKKEKPGFVFINIFKIVLWILGIGAICLLILFICFLSRNFSLDLVLRGRPLLRRRRRRSTNTPYRLSPQMRSNRRAQIREARKRAKNRSKK